MQACYGAVVLVSSSRRQDSNNMAEYVQDYFILSEMEAREAHHKQPEMGWQTSMRMSSLASNQFSRPGSERCPTMDTQMSESLLGTSEFPQVCLFHLAHCILKLPPNPPTLLSSLQKEAPSYKATAAMQQVEASHPGQQILDLGFRESPARGEPARHL